MKRLLAFLILASCAFAGTWVMTPGKGAHASAVTDVTIDTSARTNEVNSVSSYTIDITVGSHSNRVLYVLPSGDISGGGDAVASVSSNVDGALTEVSQIDEGFLVWVQIWRLTNPTVGAHTITVNYVGTLTWSEIHAVSLYNVHQTTPNGTATTFAEAIPTTTLTPAAVTLAAGDMAIGMGRRRWAGGGAFTITTGTTLQSEGGYVSGYNTGSGSVAIVWTTVDNDGGAAIVVPINKAP